MYVYSMKKKIQNIKRIIRVEDYSIRSSVSFRSGFTA